MQSFHKAIALIKRRGLIASPGMFTFSGLLRFVPRSGLHGPGLRAIIKTNH